MRRGWQISPADLWKRCERAAALIGDAHSRRVDRGRPSVHSGRRRRNDRAGRGLRLRLTRSTRAISH